MRFELDSAMIAALRSDTSLQFGTDHAGYPYTSQVPAETIQSLLGDLSD